mmetsp:Transcript_44817/g.74670  ORF Transcript_44817/g.74670 Transcript_44817/m.74670 type:complete len:97 (+) Transcript_44817:517-807(+)
MPHHHTKTKTHTNFTKKKINIQQTNTNNPLFFLLCKKPQTINHKEPLSLFYHLLQKNIPHCKKRKHPEKPTTQNNNTTHTTVNKIKQRQKTRPQGT